MTPSHEPPGGRGQRGPVLRNISGVVNAPVLSEGWGPYETSGQRERVRVRSDGGRGGATARRPCCRVAPEARSGGGGRADAWKCHSFAREYRGKANLDVAVDPLRRYVPTLGNRRSSSSRTRGGSRSGRTGQCSVGKTRGFGPDGSRTLPSGTRSGGRSPIPGVCGRGRPDGRSRNEPPVPSRSSDGRSETGDTRRTRRLTSSTASCPACTSRMWDRSPAPSVRWLLSGGDIHGLPSCPDRATLRRLIE